MSPLPADLGEGAVLRRLTMGDLDAVWALVDAERLRPDPWMPWIDGTVEDQRRWLESVVHDERRLDGCIVVGGRDTGGAGRRWDPFDVRGEIGYRIAAAAENARSRALPERLGFVMEGIARGGERGSRGFYDLLVNSLLEHEWLGAS